MLVIIVINLEYVHNVARLFHPICLVHLGRKHWTDSMCGAPKGLRLLHMQLLSCVTKNEMVGGVHLLSPYVVQRYGEDLTHYLYTILFLLYTP